MGTSTCVPSCFAHSLLWAGLLLTFHAGCEQDAKDCSASTDTLSARTVVVCRQAADMAMQIPDLSQRLDLQPPPVQHLTHLWSRSYPAPPDGLRVDPAGGILLTGLCPRNTDFGLGPICNGSGSDYVFVNKLDDRGVRVWASAYTSSYRLWPTPNLMLSDAGDAIITGISSHWSYESSYTFPCGSLSATTNSYAYYIAQITNASGSCMAGSAYETTNYGAADGPVAVNKLQTQFWAGNSAGGLTLDTRSTFRVLPYTFLMATRQDGSGLIRDYSSPSMYPPVYVYWQHMLADGVDNTYLLGNTLSSTLLAKVDSSGQEVWRKNLPGAVTLVLPRPGMRSGSNWGRMALSSSGRVAVAMYLPGARDFGGGSIGGSGTNLFVAVYDATTGAHLFSRGFPIQPADASVDMGSTLYLRFMSSGDLVVGGSFNQSLDLGGGQLVAVGSAAGDSDIFIGLFDGTGTHIASKRFGSLGTDVLRGMDVDSQNNLVITGSMPGAIDLGGGPIVGNYFVGKLAR